MLRVSHPVLFGMWCLPPLASPKVKNLCSAEAVRRTKVHRGAQGHSISSPSSSCTHKSMRQPRE